MGNWTIVITGVGCHHNGNPKIDADLAAAEFAKTLLAQGHSIESATFTSGAKQELLREGKFVNTEFPVPVFVNGRMYMVSSIITYDDIVKLSGLKGTPTMTAHTIGVQDGPGSVNRTLAPGDKLEIKSPQNGKLSFTVAHTGDA